MERKHIYDIWLQSALVTKCDRVEEIADYYGTSQRIYETGDMQLRISGLFTKAEINRLIAKDLTQAEHIYKRCIESEIDIISYFDSAYPHSLKKIPNPPVVLYTKGTIPDFESVMKIGIVGTREPSLLGKQMAYEFGYQLTKNNALIISGGAEGIDTESHRGAMLAGGNTVCVLGCGINCPFPKAGQRLRQEVAKRGLLLSEYPPDSGGSNYSYPDRNRIISGISEAVVIVEAGPKSGSLITAGYAAAQNRPVFAVPGNIDNRNCFGTNGLLTMGAGVITGYNILLDWYKTNKRTASDLGQNFTEENVQQLRRLDFFDPIPYVRGIGMLYPVRQKDKRNKKTGNTPNADENEYEADNNITEQHEAASSRRSKSNRKRRLKDAEPAPDIPAAADITKDNTSVASADVSSETAKKKSNDVKNPNQTEKNLQEQLTGTIKTVYDTISETPKNASDIAEVLKMNVYNVMAALTELEMDGLITLVSFGRYVRK